MQGLGGKSPSHITLPARGQSQPTAFPAICLSGAQKTLSNDNNAGLAREEAGSCREATQDGAPGAPLLPAKNPPPKPLLANVRTAITRPPLQMMLHISRDTEQKALNTTLS